MKYLCAFLIILALFTPINAQIFKYEVPHVDHGLLIKSGFIEEDIGIYHTEFKEYDKYGNYIGTSEIYIIVKERIYVFYR